MSRHSKTADSLLNEISNQSNIIGDLWKELEDMILDAEIYLSDEDNQIYAKIGGRQENITKGIEKLVFKRMLNSEDMSKIEIENEDGIVAEISINRYRTCN